MRNHTPAPRIHVDLSPVMGLVAILIPMLLMAYAPHVFAVIESDAPSLCAGACGPSHPSQLVIPAVTVTRSGLTLRDVVVESGAPLGELVLPCAGPCHSEADYDWTGLQAALQRTREETLGSGTVTILPGDDVSYDVLVKTLDTCRERISPDGVRQSLYPKATLSRAN